LQADERLAISAGHASRAQNWSFRLPRLWQACVSST